MTETIQLLKHLISTPSFSGEESETAYIIYKHLVNKGVNTNRYLNNVWAKSKNFDPNKPTLLLNTHHDTVRPTSGYTKNPFSPIVEGDKLYGLGSNDAGASLVALIEVFLQFYNQNLNYNLILAITAEEETICKNGISALWEHLGKINASIVGEPTKMNVAIAERGLLVLDCVAKGVSGHAARDEGVNAIYKAFDAIEWFRNYKFPKVSDLMGEVKMTVTEISALGQHNIIPSECSFVVDIRPTDRYKNIEILEIVCQEIVCQVKPRSLFLNASSISEDHSLVKNAKQLGIKTSISPTTSDISRIPVPSIKMGPGNSSRSHTANEYVYISEIEEGINVYKKFLENLEL